MWFPSALKIETESQHRGKAPQSSSHAPVSIGERKTEITIYIPFFSKAGELWSVSMLLCAASSGVTRCYFKGLLSVQYVNRRVLMKWAFVGAAG